MYRLLVFSCVFICITAGTIVADESLSDSSLRWWKGNLHTHSLWSDGDEFPEMIAIGIASKATTFWLFPTTTC